MKNKKEWRFFSWSVYEQSATPAPETRFNIRLWRLCFTVWDTHSAPFRPINPHSAFNLRVFASYSPPPSANPCRRGSVAMATSSVPTPNRGAPTTTASALRSRGKAIIIDGERKRAEQGVGCAWNGVGGFRSFLSLRIGWGKSAPSRFPLLSGLPFNLDFI